MSSFLRPISSRGKSSVRELYESDAFFLDVPPPCEPYLFRSRVGRVEFISLEEEMTQLNDFCVILLDETERRLNKHRKDLADLASGRTIAEHPESGDISDDVIQGLADHLIPTWEDTRSFVARATVLILLSVFTEKALRSLCESLKPPESGVPRQVKGLGKIDSYLSFLRTVCHLDFDEPERISDLRKTTTRIRNAFAHGEWDETRNEIREVSISAAFMTITELLERVELSTANT